MEFFGRLHPLLLHLPIGILLLAFGLECLARWRNRTDLRPAIRLALAVGAISAVATAGTGWLLAEQGGYGEVLLDRHQWLGIGAASLALLTWLGQSRPWYFPVFSIAVLCLLLAGHFGGSLTHGSNFLFEKKSNAGTNAGPIPIRLNPDSVVFTSLIQPVLKNKCVSCHNAEKLKGDLRLDSKTFIKKGGENGPVLDSDNPSQSTLLQHIQLPLQHDNHMPPSGKPQLTAIELDLLEWWIQQGADFQTKLRDTPLPEGIERAINKANGIGQNPVFALAVSAAPTAALVGLKKNLISVQSLGAETPWLAVSFAGQPSPSSEQWASLKKISAQVVDLNLAHTKLSSSQLSSLSAFKHLVRLNLANATVANSIESVLPKMQYLESLNLTNTAVTDEVLGLMPKLPQLKRLYVWQTALTPSGMQQLAQQCPDLEIESGASQIDTTRLALRAPKILHSRSFFPDTLQVHLDYPAFKGVSLYYTLDEAASPTTRSKRYQKPIVLNQTAHVRVFATKEGWLPSPVADVVLVKKQHTPVGIDLAIAPSPKYPAEGAKSLIDGRIADVQGADTWLGFEGEHLVATLDMGAPISLNQVFVHCLENNSPWIFKPTQIQVETSVDGKQFLLQSQKRFEKNASMGEHKTHLLSCSLQETVEARYVRVLVRSPLKNPPWHPGRGQKCWIFVDEIVVE